jgi:insecticidal toxin
MDLLKMALEQFVNSEHQEWHTFVDPVGFKAVLSAFHGTEQYEAALRYYAAAQVQETSEGMFQVISLLKETLQTLGRGSNDEGIGYLRNKVDEYHRRLQNTVTLSATEVPSQMHFVWVGGAMFGANQRDYFNIWKARAPEGFTFNIWYDPDALMAFDVSRTLIQAAKADAMRSGGDQPISRVALGQLYEERLAVLRRQAFDFIHQAQRRGLGADEARIEFLVEAFAQDKSQLLAARKRYLQSHLDMADDRVRLRNAREEFASHFLWSAYDREISLRGNFAAASDLVRLQAVYQEGGTYSDLDYLPPLVSEMGGVDLSTLSHEARSGVLQLLLDHNRQLMPGRDASRYKNLKKHIPKEYLPPLEAFAESNPPLDRIFAPLIRQAASGDMLGMGASNPPTGDVAPKLMNAYIAAHPRAGMTSATLELIRYYYNVIEAVELHLDKTGRAWSDESSFGVIQNMLGEVDFPFSGNVALKQIWQTYEGSIISAIDGYHRDGVVPGAGGTIALTGPGALLVASRLFTDYQYTTRGASEIQASQYLQEGYNTATEEELISGWIERADGNSVWVQNEQQAWRDGKFKARYTGNLQELLKPGNTLTFKRGWPVVEGKPVLVTAIVQRLIDDLGDPFIRAMTDKLTGDVVFESNASLSLDERRQILNQTIDEIPQSIGAQHPRNLNELLVHLERGSLPLEQLSPLHRAIIGGLFGAQTLDAAGFADAWQAAQALASETADGGVFARFKAIEKVLLTRQPQAFQVALARQAKPGNQSAHALKALALTEPMTLKQWGQRIAQINSTAQWEYRTRILKYAASVREQFFSRGAVSVRQLPQAFLVHSPGDPGRRCYPLALLMAAAFSRGEGAERAVIGRVANASLDAHEADSRALLSALDDLSDVRLFEVGTLLGQHDLPAIMQTLEAKTDTAVLLLDTGSHALLVAKVVTGDNTSYRFFEPNFAVYGFAQGALMQQGIENHLRRDGAELAGLYGLADATDLQFRVVELNAAAIAETVLPSSLQVGSLLESAPIAGDQTVGVWDKQATLRTRQLSENARMGESLSQLDARYLTRELDLATTQLRDKYALSGEYLPLLDTVKGSVAQGFSLTMVDALNPAKTVLVTTADTRFIKIKKHIQQLVDAVSGNTGGPGAGEGGSRLSFAFAIQTLVTEMRSREYQQKAGSVPALSIAMQVQVYVSYAQLAYGVVTDSVQMINLVRQMAASEEALVKQHASLSGRLLGRVSTGVGIGFSLVNIGFDIHGLTQANNDEERSRLTTQLVFNVAALGLDLTALAVGGTVGTVASFLAVPLLGLGIGFTAIASNLGQISDKARAVGRHLFMIHEAYGQEGVECEDGVLRFAVEAVITELDLQARRVRFDSQKFFPANFSTLGLPDYSAKPEDMHRAINIREALGRADSFEFAGNSERQIHAVVLPCTPLCYYGYEYQLGSSGHGPDEDLFLRLRTYQTVYEGRPAYKGGIEAISTSFPNILDDWKQTLEFAWPDPDQRFKFFSTPSLPHILYKLLPVNKPTAITVKLDEQARQLLIPELPKEWHQLVSYDITGQSGVYQLGLTPGIVAVRLAKYEPFNDVSWLISAPWASDKQVGFEGDDLLVDGVRITGFKGFLQLKGGERFQFDREKNTWQLLSVTLNKRTADSSDEPVDMALVLTRLRALAQANRLANGYVALHHFIVPFNRESDVHYTTGYYDVAENRVLYVRNLPASLLEGVVLGAVSGQQAWFYHPAHATVWRVDVSTGLIRHAFRLLSPRKGSTIIGCELTADGKLRVVQEKTRDETTRYTLEYLISANTITFFHINAYESHWNEAVGMQAYWKAPLDRFRQPDPQLDEIIAVDIPMSTWTSAPFVGLRGYADNTAILSGWLRLSDDRFYVNDDQLAQEPVQRIMLMWDESASDAMLIYDVTHKQLLRVFSNPSGYDTALDEVIESNVIELTHSAGRYILTKADGQLFEVDKNAVLTFIGVGKRWLEQHTDWLGALPALVEQHGKQPIPVIGLAGFSHGTLLAAWCVDSQLLVSQVSPGKELALLSLTPDGQAAWLLDIEAGQLYRQATGSLKDLREVFATGTRLLAPERLPAAEKVWSEWAFVEVVADGQGLRGRTREGVNLELLDRQPARIVSVENQWSQARDSGLSLRERLKALLAGHAHAPILPVESSGGRYTYYVADQDHLYEVSARPDGQWSALLGVKKQQETLLFDPQDNLVFNRGSRDYIWLTDSHAGRVGEVLTLDSSVEISDLQPLLLDGVETLILAFGSLTQTSRVSQEAWQRLECIVLDRRRAAEDGVSVEHTLVLEMAGNERLLLSEAQGHLMLIDPDNAHTLIVRDVEPQDQESRVPMFLRMVIEGQEQRLNVEQLMTALRRTQEAGATLELKTVIDALSV